MAGAFKKELARAYGIHVETVRSDHPAPLWIRLLQVLTRQATRSHQSGPCSGRPPPHTLGRCFDAREAKAKRRGSPPPSAIGEAGVLEGGI